MIDTLADLIRELNDRGWSAFYGRNKVYYGAPHWPSYSIWRIPRITWDTEQ